MKMWIKGIGEVDINKNRKARNLKIKVQPFKGVEVIVPYGVSIEYAQQFVSSKEPWIKKHLGKMENLENKMTVFDENTSFQTIWHKLNIEKGDIENIHVKIFKGEINIIYPAVLNIRDNFVQQGIRNAIERALRSEAKLYLPPRLKELAKNHSFKYNKIFIKKNVSRWGSCSNINNINLTLHLMRLPSYLIDYVILHELCHTVEKNHGKGFWELLDKVCKGAKKLDKELSAYSTRIY